MKWGNLIIISNSAHIYSRSFNKIKDIIESQRNRIVWKPDPYGTIIITVNGNNIAVQHMNVNGKKLDYFEEKTALMAYKKIANEMKISDIAHALDIGCELQKAEIAMKKGIPYIQDRPLDL